MIGCRSGGEEAAPVLGPGGLASGVLDRRHADRAAASKLIGQRVGLMRREAKFCGRNDAGVIVSKWMLAMIVAIVTATRPSARAQAPKLSGSARHQWNICAAPGW